MSTPDDLSKHLYGYCPHCGEPGATRERRPNGDDKCTAGHIYPSRLARVSSKLDLVTLSGRLPEQLSGGAPAPIDPATGQHKDYWVLSEVERAKGFTRPVRDTYTHVGVRICGHTMSDEVGKIMVCSMDPGHEGDHGNRMMQVSRMEFDKVKAEGRRRGCDRSTKMGRDIAETYARDPKTYGQTFCYGCGAHFPVGEFVWDDGQIVGS